MTTQRVSGWRLTSFAGMTAAVLALGVVLRVLWLDADPYYYDWTGYITDEGRWVSYARQAALFNAVRRAPLFDLHLVLAPLYQLVTYVTFKLMGGVSIFGARAWTAAFGCALPLLFWRALRPVVSPQALFVGVTLLAVEVDFVSLSRVAVPEMMIVFFLAAVYFNLVCGPASPRRMFLSGLLLLLAAAVKGTVALSAGILTLVVLFLPRPPAASRVGPALRDVGWFLAGFVAPPLVFAAVVFALLPDTTSIGITAAPIRRILGFLQIATPYHIVAVPFASPMAPTLNYFTLGLWLSWLAWIGSRKGVDLDERHRRHLVASSVWTASYFVLMVVLDYFPQRYRVHLFLPMTINITVGLSALQSLGWRNVGLTSHGTAPAGPFRTSLMVLPSAIMLAPVYASTLDLIGVDATALHVQMACVAVSLAAMIGLARLYLRHAWAGLLVAFPIVAGALWLFASAPGVGHLTFWPSAEAGAELAPRLALVVAAAGIAVFWALRAQNTIPSVRAVASVYVLSFLITSLVRVAPGYLQPHYTIRDASRDLGTTLASVPSVASARAEGMFNENALHYELFSRLSRPDAVVVAFEGLPIERQILDEDYALTKTYVIYAPPEYYTTHGGAKPPMVRVYRRKE